MSATNDSHIHKQSSGSSTSSTWFESASIIKSAQKGQLRLKSVVDTISPLSSLVDEGCGIVVSASVSKPWLKCIWGHGYLIAVSYSQKAKGATQWHFFLYAYSVCVFSEKTWDLVITRSWKRDVLVHSGPAEGGGVAVGFLQVW